MQGEGGGGMTPTGGKEEGGVRRRKKEKKRPNLTKRLKAERSLSVEETHETPLAPQEHAR